MQATLDLLGRFGEQDKIDEKTFRCRCLKPIQQLWAFSDRSIRTALLRSLKGLVYLFSNEIVNKKLFDPLLSGTYTAYLRLCDEKLLECDILFLFNSYFFYNNKFNLA